MSQLDANRDRLEPSAVAASSEMSIASVTKPIGVYEAHTVVSSRPAAVAAEAVANTGAKTRQRRIGVATAPELPIIEPPRPDPPSVSAQVNNASSAYSHNYPTIKQSSLRVGEDVVCHRCSKCNAPFEEFNEEELGLCIVILSTFIHREPSLAASMLPEILRCNAKYLFLLPHYR